MAIFDDVLVPWDRGFLYGDVQLANTMFSALSKMQAHTGHQTARCAGLQLKMRIHDRARGRGVAQRQD